MSAEINHQKHLEELRKKARLQLDELDPAQIKAMTLEQISATVEELRVQQIQLEMQNAELIRTRNELEEARAGYFDLYEMAPMGYITLNQRGIVEQANLKAVSILGRDRTEILDTPFIRFIAREDHHVFHENITRVFQTQAPRTWELRINPARSERIWVRLEGAYQTMDQGPVCRLAMSDINLEKNALENLQKNEARLRAITTSAHDAIIMMDHQGKITFWNPKAVDIFGYTPQQALGNDLHHLLAPKKYHKAYRENFPHFVETGHGSAIGRTVELEALNIRGETFPVALSLSSVLLDGHWQAVGIVRDITEIKRYENELTRARDEARASARTKSEFLANMSHEIRTPLNGIMGMMQILQNTSLDQEQEEYINLALTASDRLTRLLTDILELSRIEQVHPVLHPEVFSISQVLNTIRTLFMPAARENSIELHLSSDPQIPDTLYGDRFRLEQILFHLVGNAIKFTREGQVTLKASLSPEQSSRAWHISFEVRDTGVGIPRENLDKIFEPFEQGFDAYTREFEGAGLGLALVKRTVDILGGSIEVSSQVGQGTVFSFDIPFYPLPDED